MQCWWTFYTYIHIYIYIYIYISTRWMDTLRFDASEDLRKLSSGNAHPRYGKCKHFCGSSARLERQLWVDSRPLLDGSIVLPAKVGTLNDQTIFLFAPVSRTADAWLTERIPKGKKWISRGSSNVPHRGGGGSTVYVCLHENTGSW